MPRLTDTSPEAERILIEVYRGLPVERRWRLLGDMFRTARVLQAAGTRLRDPAAGEQRHAVSEPAEELGVLREVTVVFDRLGIPYALGGSLASSIHGFRRHTADADLTAEPFPGREAAFVACFGRDYYVSESAVREAHRSRSSFNIIHTTTGFKVDVFLRKDLPFEQSAMERRLFVPLFESSQPPIAVQSPEDVILFKLRWYRLGGETSDRQWQDVLGVMKVQGERLDQGYLDRWAGELQVGDLLARCRQESAI